MRRSLKAALLWMMPVGLLSACGGAPEEAAAEDVVRESAQSLVAAPPVPPSGNIADSLMRMGDIAVGSALQEGAPTVSSHYYGYRVQVQAGAQLKFEITHLGSSMYLDTGLFLYGPKDANGSYGTAVLAQDDDAGYGQLSKIGLMTFPHGGEYLAVVGFANPAGKQFRLAVDCMGGTCLSNPPSAPANYISALVQSPITANLQSVLDAGNSVREDAIGYLTAFDFAWPYSGETTLDAAAAAILARGQYRGYRSYPTPETLTYAGFESLMFSMFTPLHPAILATYGNGTENVQVKRYYREFSTGPNGDNKRSLFVILFPRSFKVVVYEQTWHEI
ncbi:hypothetical protein A176_002061 [Myxococcus hansupus]|uniref:Lipoprotein n=1 Tax=Pseudomyxococcus hansupus TaxID=1297742 RepID=A0A0H4WQW5_9BACT|nr:hypothetical protein [Myxococcus hansupus]AKQ65149.1 hypothetical protein A176_002061 [Myxococcus hansupus]